MGQNTAQPKEAFFRSFGHARTRGAAVDRCILLGRNVAVEVHSCRIVTAYLASEYLGRYARYTVRNPPSVHLSGQDRDTNTARQL